MDVKDRAAVVTVGAGRAIALALAAAGAEVVVCDIDGTGARDTVAMAAPWRRRSETVDVTIPDQIVRLIRDVQPQILVNNAGGGGHIAPHFPDATRRAGTGSSSSP